MSADAFIAVTRFGLGARRGEIAEAARHPAAWLKRQLAPAAGVPAQLAGLPAGSTRMAELLRARQREGNAGAQRVIRDSFRETYAGEASARLAAQIASEAPFRERLVAFWANHFTVSVQRPPLRGLAGALEREAIRPHVVGRFAAMLLAVVRHPAMLVYLDNGQSVGPNSPQGLRRGSGLNENLAREILELHTVGVEGGYTQDDVLALARILTGWTLGRAGDPDVGSFRFAAPLHEPGVKTLLGHRFAHGGVNEGEDALAMLARHPATARHIATKLARHFIADVPPKAAVDRLTRVFLDTDGNLRALADALVEQPEAWATPLPKLRTPHEFVVAALRATGFAGDAGMMLPALRTLGQPTFGAPSPAGWPDTADRWIGPEAVLRRAEWSMAMGLRVAGFRDPLAIFETAIAPIASRATAQAIARAPSAGEAIALVLASPEFQRR